MRARCSAGWRPWGRSWRATTNSSRAVRLVSLAPCILHKELTDSCATRGDGFAGDYKGGYWGDCAITDDTLALNFLVGDIYGESEISCGEGFVHLNYKGGVQANGLAYTGELDKLVCERIAAVTNNVVEATSSEQGMQGHYNDDESYLSLDVFV